MAFGCAAVTLSGCASLSPNEIVTKPSNVGVSEALTQIGEGFSGMKGALGDTKLGLFPCKVTVNLNVTASANDSSKLVVDFSATAPQKVVDASGTANAEFTADSTAQRGNAVAIEMYSVACLPKETLAYDKPDKYGLILENVPAEAVFGSE